MIKDKNKDASEIQGSAIESVSEYKYFSQTIFFQNRFKIVIEQRKANAWRAHWTKKKILKGRINQKPRVEFYIAALFRSCCMEPRRGRPLKNKINPLRITYYALMRNMSELKMKEKPNSRN